ncbi:hypothetical protein [Alloyangia pacifica]|uniref:hypothetical protein n=1 Tax=Alloyangia pacifica TaxID=311180 RepID=UPI001CFED9C9|nr:hypothetical protein [Alloyangia pacifica]
MSIQSRRFFHCRSCGHKMRLGVDECGNCYQPTPMINHFPLPLLLALPVLAVAIVALVISTV